MFKIANHAIVVVNADVEVKRYASLVIDSNIEDSFVK
ncbi:HAD hydrolase family protein [Nostoc sp. ChiQUE01b]|nr:HAD hydrolase family protein [Nostoc sp. ChiQUE01b]MDZ8260801.1 hypothetical protein [Nostoc sp. ChiQUE01b]